MSKKIISSKETYFKRPGNKLSLEQWEAFKLANPQTQYTGEICWELHDSMILRGKPASDKAFVKLLLKKLNIEFEQNVDYLKITSDLAGQQIAVIEIEDDELLEQLELAGATVLYITSNPNYNINTPDKYFEMYLANYNAEDYPAIDKRHLFDGKNIIIKYINFLNYKIKNRYQEILQATLKEYDMKTNKVLMNPPYDGSLHLEILESTLKTVRAINPNAEIISIQPARWLEDPLAKHKQKSDYKTFKTSIVDKISSLSLISTYDACAKFNILLNGDLGIYVFNNKIANEINCYTSIAQAVVNKVINKLTISLADKVEANKLNGIRCEVKKLVPTVSYNDTGNAISRMQTSVKLFYGPYINGYNLNNIFWSEDRMKNQFTKAIGSPLPNSVPFTDLPEANNFMSSVTTNFYKNLIHLFKLDQNSPLNFLPYMDDYKTHAWTDEDYCKFFGLTEEEAEFMCRKIDDYRIKDFINYTKLDEE